MSCSKTCTIPVNESKLGVAAVKEGDTGGSSKQVLNAASAKARKQPNFAATVRTHSLLRNLQLVICGMCGSSDHAGHVYKEVQGAVEAHRAVIEAAVAAV